MEENNENIQNQTSNENDDKVIAILSYLGILWVIAYVMYGNKKSENNLFHLRQGLGLFIVLIALYILGHILGYIPIIGALIMLVLWIGYLIIAIMGVINAAKGVQKYLPLFGKIAESNLTSIK